MKKPITIVLTGGGSGGHITPLLSLAHALKETSPQCRIIYIGLKGETLENSLQARYKIFDEVRSVPSGKFRRYHGENFLAHLTDLRTLALNIRDFFRVLGGIKSANKILKQTKPDVVFSKGGFVVVPVGIAARLQKIPIVTHDSDTIPGLANRIIGKFATVHATGMPASQYSYPPESIHYIGIPLDERIKPITASIQSAYKKELDIPADSRLLLVAGGGLGAQDINKKILAVASDLLSRYKDLHIVHITGQKNEAEVGRQYQSAPVDYTDRLKVVGFSTEFYKYSGAADLVITRAGATTIAELAAQRKPVILIPAPHLTGGHQLKNAEELQKHKAVKVVANNAPPEQLLAAITQILDSKSLQQQLADNLGGLAKVDASKKLAELVLSIADKPKSLVKNAQQ